VQRPSFFDETVDGKPGEIPHVELRKRQLYTIDGFRQIKGIAASDMVPAESIEPAKKFPMNIDALIKAKGNKGGGTSTNLDPALLNYIKDWLAATEAEAMRQADSSISDEVATKQGREHAKLLLAQGGLKFYTTIEPKLQNNLVQSIGRLPKRGLAAGGIIMNAETGAVAAMYGGTDGNNHALYAERQPGSVMKTVVLANMVKEGISVKSELPAPACIKMDKQSKEQCNDDNNPGGGTACKLSIEKAVALSNNPVFLESISGKMAPSCNEATNPDKLVAVSDDYPVSPKSATDLAHKMGADDSTVPVKTSPAKLDPVPSFTLGASSLTPLKVASIGATLVDGVHNKPYIIQKIMLGAGKGTEVAYEQKDQSARVLSQEQAGIVNQVLTRVYTEGTARGAQVPGHPLAGKTGTTPFDAWMLAWSPIDPNKKVPSLVCSVWAGYPDNRKTSEKGGDLWGADVAKVCQGFYTEAFKGAPKVDFPAANLDSGKKVGLNK
jgi:membrane peptidoglycan carboxypeptidase